MIIRIIVGGCCGMLCYWLGFFTASLFKNEDDN